jgi:hypothetical protein
MPSNLQCICILYTTNSQLILLAKWLYIHIIYIVYLIHCDKRPAYTKYIHCVYTDYIHNIAYTLKTPKHTLHVQSISPKTPKHALHVRSTYTENTWTYTAYVQSIYTENTWTYIVFTEYIHRKHMNIHCIYWCKNG